MPSKTARAKLAAVAERIKEASFMTTAEIAGIFNARRSGPGKWRAPCPNSIQTSN